MSTPLRAVWSFWSKPYQTHGRATWASDRHHLLSWILSWQTARRHYAHTELYTDAAGARLLVEGLGIEFTHVHTSLDALDDADPQWWVLGKLHAYRAQTEPFVHIDSDVFLWKPLPEPTVDAAVFAQNPEPFAFDGASWYRPSHYHALLSGQGGWMPEEWRWFVARRGAEALCCGILGGQRADFLSYYAGLAIRMLQDPNNQRLWPQLSNRLSDNIVFEQYLLSACIAYHHEAAASPYAGIAARCLFASAEQAQRRASELGYTHLIGNAKQHAGIVARLEQRVARDYPEHYARCSRLSRTAA